MEWEGDNYIGKTQLLSFNNWANINLEKFFFLGNTIFLASDCCPDTSGQKPHFRKYSNSVFNATEWSFIFRQYWKHCRLYLYYWIWILCSPFYCIFCGRDEIEEWKEQSVAPIKHFDKRFWASFIIHCGGAVGLERRCAYKGCLTSNSYVLF
jgi:hypothetical protein